MLTRPIFPSTRLRTLLPVALLVLSAFLLWQTKAVQRAADVTQIAATPRFHPAISRPAPDESPLSIEVEKVPVPIQIERGQTLSTLFADHGLDPVAAQAASQAVAEHIDVRSLRAGDAAYVFHDENTQLASLRLDRTDGWVEVTRSGDGWRSRWHAYERQVSQKRIAGQLDGALESAVRTAGGPSLIAFKMADVLQWDLDFNRDLRRGDRFEVLYEEVYLDGGLAGSGNVLGLVYDNQGTRFEAYRFEDGYYDAEGRPLQKMFLRSPLPFSRITSKFNLRRFHPVLKRHRPHYGVDYGAPTGTPVRVTASGVVTFAGRNGGAGNMVKVRHPNGYLTAYLHLSRFGKGIRSGKRVTQGELIGYVGSTGLSTGPHLDYRVQRAGKWIDPLSLKRLPAEPVPEAQRAAFLLRRDAYRRAMDRPGDRQLVQFGVPSSGPTSAR